MAKESWGKHFRKNVTNLKLWMQWIILASILTFYIINSRELISRINLDEITAAIIYFIVTLTIFIAVIDTITEKILGV